MKTFIYLDARRHGVPLIFTAPDKQAARAYVCRMHGYDALPRRHCLASVSP